MTDIARLRERLHRREARAQVRAEARTRRLARRARQRVDRLRQQATLFLIAPKRGSNPEDGIAAGRILRVPHRP